MAASHGTLALASLVAFLAPSLVRAQHSAPLYQPRAVALAFKHDTRSLDGRPGPNYWENHGRYTITLSMVPPDRTISGAEQIVYTNNSPDTLSRLVFKLFINIHKPGAPRDDGASDAYLTSGVHIDGFTVDGRTAAWPNDSRYFTWQPVALPARLAPHDSVRMTVNWHYEISRQANREGMLDSTTYYLAYFYPRVAVYDDYNGWDTMDFTDLQEFYSDFNDYDVTLRVPANYVVWGTGTLRNPSEVLSPDAAQRFQSSLASDAVVHVATQAQLAAHAITQQNATNAWHFTATNVPDVTFAVSDHYDWDASSVLVDDAAHRRAGVQAAYNDTAVDFHHMVGYGRHSLDWLSHNWPGVPYPYEKTTIVQGGADMEYPMMVNDGSNADTTFSRFVVEHEIAHTYFPFYMGINETRYGFMDEGWATTFEYLIGTADIGKAAETSFYQQFRVNQWAHDPSPLEDLPIVTPEDVLKGVAYGNNAYGKASLGYLAVKDLLGDATFKKCLQAFMDRWHGKHPIPWDFFDTFDDVSGQDLNWFFTPWYFENSYIDMGVAGLTKTNGGYTLTIDNIGGMPAPVDVKVTYDDGTTEAMHETPAIWRANVKRAAVHLATSKTIRSLELDGGIWVDADSSNNRWSAP
jgi:hypothetical protein